MSSEIGRWLIGAGILLMIVGIVVVAAGRLPWLGRLPGDLVFRRGGLTVFMPIGTMILLSLVLTIVANLLARFWRQ